MRRFIVSFESFPISVEDVKEGTNQSQVITACRCINVGLFLSGDMRRDVEVAVVEGRGSNLGVLSFPGWQLRRVSPDERSISYFLLKAHNELQNLKQDKTMEMPNGIIVMKTDFTSLIESWDSPDVFMATTGASLKSMKQVPKDGVFAFETKNGLLLENSCDINPKPLPRPVHPERFILDINLLQDRRNRANEKSS